MVRLRSDGHHLRWLIGRYLDSYCRAVCFTWNGWEELRDDLGGELSLAFHVER